MIDQRGAKVELEIDGGIKVENVAAIAQAGADILVSGSAIFESKDYKDTIQKMRRAVGS
jgi:ribulose-phosphate 3-epimerase